MTGTPSRLRLRLLFVVFVWYCSAVSTVLQSFFTGFLVDPGYENPLTSLEEMLDSGIEFGYPDGFDILFSVSSDLRHTEVVERGERCGSETECIERIHETSEIAAFVAAWAVQNYTNTINDRSSFCRLNEDDYSFSFVTTYVQ